MDQCPWTAEIEGAIEVKALSPGDAAVRLPWLAPRRASLVAPSRLLSPPDWSDLRTDPGLLLLLLRQTGPDAPAADLAPAVWEGPAALDAALGWLAPETPGFADGNHPAARPVFDAVLTFAG